MSTFRFRSVLLSLFVLWMLSATVNAQQLTLTPLHSSGIYEVGEKVGWTIAMAGDAAAPVGKYEFTIKKNNFTVLKTGTFELSSGKATLETSLDEPGMIYVQIVPQQQQDQSADKPSDGKDAKAGGPPAHGPITVGAAVAPTKIQPSVPRPADFDEFWKSKIKLLTDIPENAVLTPGDSGKPNVEFVTITMDNINGGHVHGQIAKPKKEGKFPALLILQWASPPYPLQKSWVTDHAAKGWLALNIEPHDVLPDQPPEYYKALPKEIKNYQTIGNDDREKSYFLQMYLADYRAVDYLANRPDWDGKTLVVMGTSMGGQQSLCVAGLNPKVTHVIVNEPAGCDTNGPLHGRQSGYPNFPPGDPKIMETALYFDTVNFTPHIKAPSLVAMGFVDTIAPPAGIFAAFNQIVGPKEAVPMVDSPHNNLATPAQQHPYTSGSAKWLSTLVKGEQVDPAGK